MTPYYQDEYWTTYCGNTREVLSGMEAESVHCVITSPPYWGLRDYRLPPLTWGSPYSDACGRGEHAWGDESILRRQEQRDHNGHNFGDSRGSEPSRNGMTASQGQFCRKCGAWRGCLGLEPTLDLYVQHLVEIFQGVRRVLRKDGVLWLNLGDSYSPKSTHAGHQKMGPLDSKASLKNLKGESGPFSDGLKPKDLCMMPFRVAMALQADGWYLRQDDHNKEKWRGDA